MATDVARLSFDSGRNYTGVVSQQGRVSLEAEQNEQRVIDAEERRKELLDIVGPAGTPDDGYAVSFLGDELIVGPGTMYVGGLRVELDAPVSYADQPDWLDRVRSIDFGLGHVVLLLRETDVTAVEDAMLYEPALGGPDGAARTRLLQHIELLTAQQKTCSAALAQDEKDWITEGATFDPKTMQLESNGRLLVTWQGLPDTADPCEPSSTGGYLGAENQLIRVQIVDVSEDGSTFSILWGYDDASMLYRVTPDTSADPVLTLQRSPVDDFHRPRGGQAVQVLRSTAALPSTDGVIEGYVAALTGEVGVLGAPYDPDTKTVTFPASLPAAYTDTTQTPQLYLRVWEELLTGNALGSPITLTGTGVQVTITLDGGGVPRIGDFWCIAVRPSTPTTVYPDRLLRAPQPPDGPREWVCPLAVVEITDQKNPIVVEDCRVQFPPLTAIEEEGCCTVEVHASDVSAGKLQDIVDKAVSWRDPNNRAGRVTICFSPGRYELLEPLVLSREHSNITLQACTQGAIVSVAPGREGEFGQGMFVLTDVDEVTITGFEFELPHVSAGEARIGGASGSTFNREAIRAINEVAANRFVSIAIRAIDCAVLEVADCTFRFSVGVGEAKGADDFARNVFGIAIFAAGGAWGLRLRHNLFSHHPETRPAEREVGSRHALVGYLLVPSATHRKEDLRTKSLGAASVAALLDTAEVVDNTFHGITVPMLVIATIGSVRIWDNAVDHCYGGFWLLDASATANIDLVGDYKMSAGAAEVAAGARTAIAGLLLDENFVYIVTLGETYPLPLLGGWVPRNVAEFEKAKIATLRSNAKAAQSGFMRNVVEQLNAGHEVVGEAASSEAASSDATSRSERAEKATPRAKRQSTVDFNPGTDQAPAQKLVELSPAYATAWAAINELQRIANEPERLDTSIHIESNAIDCRSVGETQSGPALFVFSIRKDDATACAIVANNRMFTTLTIVNAVLIGPQFATITGNVVATGARTYALAVAIVPEVAISGNVVRGTTLMPTRPFAAPLDTWRPLNTING
jgi:Family of unknown function (DUF6519)